MKINFISLLFVALLTGCEVNPINGGYKKLGEYPTKLEAQNRALQQILSKFGSLPSNNHYKVAYAYPSTSIDPGTQAMWYNRATQRFSVEVDIHSGIACSWDKVDKSLLERAIVAKRGVFGVDSLASSARNQSSCF